MKKYVALALALLLTMPLLPACDVMGALEIMPVPTPSLSLSPTPAQTPMPTPSPAPTPTPSPEPTLTPTPEQTPSPSPSPSPHPPVVIKFKDRVVEKIIRILINKPKGPVTDRDMLKVYDFTTSIPNANSLGGKIKTLADLRWCPNLRSVFLVDTKIKDISALSGTQEITKFECTEILDDYTPLFANKKLNTIYLRGATDGAFKKLMANCSQLKEITLVESKISYKSIRILAKNYNLSVLKLIACGITDISPIAGFKHLEFLGLEHNHIQDLSPLAGKDALSSEIDLMENDITDWSPLEGMTSLLTLHVRGNPTTESPALDKLEKNGCVIYR